MAVLLSIFSNPISLILRQLATQSQWLVPFSNLPRRFALADIARLPTASLMREREMAR